MLTKNLITGLIALLIAYLSFYRFAVWVYGFQNPKDPETLDAFADPFEHSSLPPWAESVFKPIMLTYVAWGRVWMANQENLPFSPDSEWYCPDEDVISKILTFQGRGSYPYDGSEE